MKFLFIVIITSWLMACNIGIALDSNNIPVIWKNRDRPICTTPECIIASITPEDENDSCFFNPNLATERANWIFLRNYDNWHDIISVSSASCGSKARYMASNDKGLVIVNSVVDADYGETDSDSDSSRIEFSRDYPYDNDDLLTHLLRHCIDVSCVDTILNELKTSGNSVANRDISSNYAVIDSYGNGKMCEVYANSDSFDYICDSLSDSNRYIVRTNDFVSLDYTIPDLDSQSQIRYNQSNTIMSTIINGFSFEDLFIQSDRNIMPLLRNFSNQDNVDHDIPYYEFQENVPFGYFNTKFSINRAKTVSSIVAVGGNAENGNSEAVIWANLGNPITSPFFPIKITDFIDYSNNQEGDSISSHDIAFSNYDPLDATSSFSIETHRMRERIINYNQNSEFDRYINSFLIDDMMNHLNAIEQDFIDNIYNDTPAQRIDRIHDAIDSTEIFYDSYNGCIGGESLTGDLDCNDDINILDLVIIISIIIEVDTHLPDNVETLSDFNQDGSIDILDVVLLVDFILDHEN